MIIIQRKNRIFVAENHACKRQNNNSDDSVTLAVYMFTKEK